MRDALLGTVLRRRWTLERVIGRGGTATVYAATHRNGSRVAIKVLHPSLQTNPVIRDRFLREGYIANRIGARDVVNVIDDDVDGNVVYLVMELLQGASVDALRDKAGGRLAPADVVEIACRLLVVLEAAHARGILHRDIKPANLFRTVDPVGFKVLDFGIAALIDERRAAVETEPGSPVFLGTPVFTAPEQARCQGEPLDARTDLWAVGATLFTLLTGQYVNAGHTTTEVLQAARYEMAPDRLEQLSSAPPQLAAIVDRALAFEPASRFQSASAMRLACEECRRTLTARGEHSRCFDRQPQRSTRQARFASDDGVSALSEAATPDVLSLSPQPLARSWLGRVGRLWWFYYVGTCTDEIWVQYLQMVQRMLDTGEAATLACFAHRAEAPNALQRKRLADFVRKNRDSLRRLDRFALVIDSVLHRGAITAINWLVEKPFEERVFNSPLAAIKWLTENHTALDPRAVRASIIGQVPSHSCWPCLQLESPETIVKSAAY